MGIRVGFDLVVFHTTDRAVHFQHGQRDVMNVRDAVLAQRALQFVHADVLARHVRFDGLSIMNEQAGLALNHSAETTIACRSSVPIT